MGFSKHEKRAFAIRAREEQLVQPTGRPLPQWMIGTPIMPTRPPMPTSGQPVRCHKCKVLPAPGEKCACYAQDVVGPVPLEDFDE